MTLTETLNFELLEDIMSLSDEEINKIVSNSNCVYIGPVVEYLYNSYPKVLSNLTNIKHEDFRSILLKSFTLDSVQLNNQINSFSKTIEFVQSPVFEDDVLSPGWDAFLLRMEKCAISSGLDKHSASALVGTLAEMVENLIIHSRNSKTGIAGYRRNDKQFEYVVCDSGVGVLESLRNHPDYSDIRDYNEALHTAIRNGESRFGKNNRHGTGFNNLILNISKRCSNLRFRSGDHSLTIDGIASYTTGNAPEIKTRMCSYFQGFLVSVLVDSSK
jgi:hypothetical protein